MDFWDISCKTSCKSGEDSCSPVSCLGLFARRWSTEAHREDQGGYCLGCNGWNIPSHLLSRGRRDSRKSWKRCYTCGDLDRFDYCESTFNLRNGILLAIGGKEGRVRFCAASAEYHSTFHVYTPTIRSYGEIPSSLPALNLASGTKWTDFSLLPGARRLVST
jgi:hypothetical protein